MATSCLCFLPHLEERVSKRVLQSPGCGLNVSPLLLLRTRRPRVSSVSQSLRSTGPANVARSSKCIKVDRMSLNTPNNTCAAELSPSSPPTSPQRLQSLSPQGEELLLCSGWRGRHEQVPGGSRGQGGRRAGGSRGSGVHEVRRVWRRSGGQVPVPRPQT